MQRFTFNTIVLLGLLALVSCETNSGLARKTPVPGRWTIFFDIGDSVPGVTIPINLLITTDGDFNIENQAESITLCEVERSADSMRLKCPYYQTFLTVLIVDEFKMEGFLEEPTRSKEYRIPFTAKYDTSLAKEYDGLGKEYVFDVTFSEDDSINAYKAIALFSLNGNVMSGTFLTESGDYRFLSGRMEKHSTEEKKQFYLSSWDGAHLFYFEGVMEGDSAKNGLFCSGNHWSESWVGINDPDIQLRNPDSITYLVNPLEQFEFQANNARGDSIYFGKEYFDDSVTIIQLFGSWCPNCTDESIFLKGLFQKYGDQGLQILPVAFERIVDGKFNPQIVIEQFRELEIPYNPYFGRGKGFGKECFNMLNDVVSMPTTIIIDRSGKVRKIHTGFYGPSTGHYYLRYSEGLDLFVQQLLKE